MDGKASFFARSTPGVISEQSSKANERIIEFYEEAGRDYDIGAGILTGISVIIAGA